MSENQLFCWSMTYGDSLSKQQKDFRVFNQEVPEGRYEEIIDLVKNIIPNPQKLKLDDFWKSLTEDQISKLSEIPEFDSIGFEYITGRKAVAKRQLNLSGKKVAVIIDGETFNATID
jgi:hypothetical protein